MKGIIYISCHRKHNHEIERVMQEEEILFTQKSAGLLSDTSIMKSELTARMFHVFQSDCMIFYSNKGEDIDMQLIEAGACIASNKEVIITGDNSDHPAIKKLLSYRKCILRVSIPDAFNYARSMYYRPFAL